MHRALRIWYDSGAMSGPLTGKRVLDLTWGIAGPMAGMIMADYGADVIRIESPRADPLSAHPGYVVWNRGKRSVTLDVFRPEGVEALDRLLAGADVLIESFQPGVADRYGFGWETVHAKHPRVVYTSISGYGQEGEDRDRPGYDGLIQARMGLQELQPGFRDGPKFVGFSMASTPTSFLAMIGTLTALYIRETTGLGQHVDTSLRQGALSMLTMQWATAEKGRDSFNVSFWDRKLLVDLFQCGDGKWLHMHTGAQGAYDRFVEGVEMPQFMDKKQTEEMWAEMRAGATEWYATHTREEALDMLKRQDIPALPVEPPGGALRDPQARPNGFVQTVHDPMLGDLDEVGMYLKFEKTPGAIQSSAPLRGANTDEALAEAGYSAAEIEGLRALGVI